MTRVIITRPGTLSEDNFDREIKQLQTIMQCFEDKWSFLTPELFIQIFGKIAEIIGQFKIKKNKTHLEFLKQLDQKNDHFFCAKKPEIDELSDTFHNNLFNDVNDTLNRIKNESGTFELHVVAIQILMYCEAQNYHSLTLEFPLLKDLSLLEKLIAIVYVLNDLKTTPLKIYTRLKNGQTINRPADHIFEDVKKAMGVSPLLKLKDFSPAPALSFRTY